MKRKNSEAIVRYIEESGEKVDNGYHEIYINAENDDKSEIAEVMKIMSTKDYISKEELNRKIKELKI